MPKTPDEIKKGLECCTSRDCGGNICPYFNEKSCNAAKSADAIALIQQKEQENAEQAERIQQLESKLGCSQMTIDGLTATLLKCDAIIKQLEVDKVRLLEESHEVRKDMFERIKLLEAQVPKWISVEERLPENYEDVNVFVVGDDGSWFINTGYYAGTHWRAFSSTRRDKVTHWMPLPEPPKEATS